MRNDVSVVATVMSVDHDCAPEITAMVGVSIALSISDIPWNGPISGVSVGLVDGEYVINPTAEQRKVSRMAVTVASTEKKIPMIEAGANEVSDEEMFNGIMAGHEANQHIIAFIKEIQAEIGKPKFEYPAIHPSDEMFEAVKAFAEEDIKAALDTDDKTVRDARLKPVYEKVHEKFDPIYPDQSAELEECLYKTQKFVVRRWLLDEQKRVDGRQMDQMRPLAAEIDLLPRVHGSGMFTPRPDAGAHCSDPRAGQRPADAGRHRPRRSSSAISTSTISRPTPSVRRSPAAARAAVKSVTAHWQSARWCR